MADNTNDTGREPQDEGRETGQQGQAPAGQQPQNPTGKQQGQQEQMNQGNSQSSGQADLSDRSGEQAGGSQGGGSSSGFVGSKSSDSSEYLQEGQGNTTGQDFAEQGRGATDEDSSDIERGGERSRDDSSDIEGSGNS
jgi:hypothetical protein